MTDKQKRPKLHVERWIADERHPQLGVSDQVGDAQVAETETRKTTEGTAEARFYGLRKQRSPSGAKTKSKSEVICTA
jgi:hypothetical protein